MKNSSIEQRRKGHKAVALIVAHPWARVSTPVVMTAKYLAMSGYSVDLFIEFNERLDNLDICLPDIDNASIGLAHVHKLDPAAPLFIFRDGTPLPLTHSSAVHQISAGHSGDYDWLIGFEPGGLARAAALSELWGRPYIYHNLELWDAFAPEKNLEKICNKKALFTITQDDLRADILAHLNYIPRGSIFVSTNSSIGDILPEKKRFFHERFPVGDRKIVLTTGSLIPITGTEEILRSTAAWPEDYVLILHGFWSDQNFKRRALAMVAGQNNVFFSEEILSAEQKFDIFQSVDLGLAFFTARDHNCYYAAKSAGKIYDCMRCGVPVIGNNIPGMKELLEGNGCGLTVNSAAELAHGMPQIIKRYDFFRNNCLRVFPTYEFTKDYARILRMTTSLLAELERKDAPASETRPGWKDVDQSMKTRWSAIIPTHNRVNALAGVLNCLVKQTLPGSIFEILVVDNGSTDATPELTRQFIKDHPGHRIRYLHESTPGLLAGRHRGALEAKAEILTFFDDDVEFEAHLGAEILRIFSDERVSLAGGPSFPQFESSPPDWLEHYQSGENGQVICGPLSLLDYGDKALDIDPDLVWGLNYSIRRATLFELGGFHPDGYPKSHLIFRGDGESGLSRKVKDKGLIARYSPLLKVIHHIPSVRLTEEGMQNRFFAQGVSDSYTRIRRHEGLPALDVPVPEMESDDPDQSRHARIRNAYIEGYVSHQLAARASVELLNWILQPDYFDYALPPLNPACFKRIKAKDILNNPLKVLEDPVSAGAFALQCLKGQRWREALKILTQLEVRYPTLAEIKALKAKALMELGQFGEAVAYAQEELAANPLSEVALEVYANSIQNLPALAAPAATPRDEKALQSPGESELGQSVASRPTQTDDAYQLSKTSSDNTAFFLELKEKLRVLGANVREQSVDIPDFLKWWETFPEIINLYKGHDYQIEKGLEHYLSYKLLNLAKCPIYIDVAAHSSVLADTLEKKLGTRAYKLDMAYPAGINNRQIGCDAGHMCLPDNFADAMSLQCAYECFMGDADQRFLAEAARVLRPGGAAVILPLYMLKTPLNRIGPDTNLQHIALDLEFLPVWRNDGFNTPFSRTYSPETFIRRLHNKLPDNLSSQILYLDNIEELSRLFPGQRIYCYFVWHLTKMV